MKIIILTAFLLAFCFACKNDRNASAENGKNTLSSEMVFDKEKWSIKQGGDYTFREKMLKDVVYNDTVRSLKKEEILNLLGEPDRINGNYLYYMIAQTRLGSWPMHTKTMVIKLSGNNTIEWIKIHG